MFCDLRFFGLGSSRLEGGSWYVGLLDRASIFGSPVYDTDPSN